MTHFIKKQTNSYYTDKLVLQYFLKMGHSRPLFLYFRLFNTVGSKQMFIWNVCQWLDLNLRPLVSEANPLKMSHNHYPGWFYNIFPARVKKNLFNLKNSRSRHLMFIVVVVVDLWQVCDSNFGWQFQLVLTDHFFLVSSMSSNWNLFHLKMPLLWPNIIKILMVVVYTSLSPPWLGNDLA